MRDRSPAPPYRQPPAEVSRARGWTVRSGSRHGRVRRFRRSACAVATVPPLVCPSGRPGAGATPTRSARTPLVMRSLDRRVETPANLPRSGATVAMGETPIPRSGRCGPRAPEGAHLSRSHLTSPCPREGLELAGPRRPARARPPAARSHARLATCLEGRCARCVACADTPGAEGRISRPSAKKSEVRCTRGAFHR